MDGPRSPLLPTLVEFNDRLSRARRQVPEIVRSAEAAAERTTAHPLALISTPSWSQEWFGDELSNRAGGLGNINYPDQRAAENTPDDVALFAVRSWEKEAATVVPLLKEYKGKGWSVTVFASAAGRPADLACDFFIDNGAPDPGAAHAPVNAVVDAMNGWVWCCEYVAAMTRRGRCPGVLMSVSYAKAELYDGPLQKQPGGRQWQGECRHPVPAGELAEIYLRRTEQLARDLASTKTQAQIHEAAQIIAERVASGRRVMVSGIGHMIVLEFLNDLRAPGWKSFNCIGGAKKIKDSVHEGDLLVWIGYLGMDSAYEDFLGGVRDSKADLISCVSPDPDPSKNGPWAVAHVDQSWALGDSEVPIPCPPGRMAPISGLDSTLLFRMLEEESTRIGATLPATTQP